MIHLGDITKISGYTAPVVDCVIGGSPCQDLSIAGKRLGLAGERSGLFMEQIRVVKEMRKEDERRGRTGRAIRPRFMLWENVPGAFSSNGGNDFRAVLEETIRVAAPNAPAIPLPPGGRWPLADTYYGDGWSIAYRVFDAQFWGVPQIRRRIALVADFGGHAAPKILFERQGLPGDIETGKAEGATPPARVGDGLEDTRRIAIALRMRSGCEGGGKGALIQTEKSGTLGCNNDQTIFCMATQQGGTEIRRDDKAPTLTAAAGMSGNNQPVIATIYENHGQDSRINGPLEVAPTVNAKYGTGGNNTPLVYQVTTRPHSAEEAPTWERTEVAGTLNTFDTGEARAKELVVMAFNGGQSGKARGMGIGVEISTTIGASLAPPVVAAVDCRNGTIDPEINGTLQAKPNGGMSLNLNNVVLTYPAEIAHTLRATGDFSFRADADTLIMATGQSGAEITKGIAPTLNCDHEQPIIYATNVRRLTPLECERLQGYPDGWTDIGAWIDGSRKLHRECTDSARYKALGNSIALPPWRWVLRRLCRFYRRTPTMASLFDGIGGFPLIWEQLNGAGSCLWASEIEDFPIAVTRKHFPERRKALG